MAENFRRLVQRGIGTTDTRVGGYTVAADTKVVVIGMSIANAHASSPARATLRHHDGTNATIIAAATLMPGDALAPAGEMNKLVLETGDGIFVQSTVAASLDVVVSILEITP